MLENKNNVNADEKTAINASAGDKGNIPVLTVFITRLSAKINPNPIPIQAPKNKTVFENNPKFMYGPTRLPILFAPNE